MASKPVRTQSDSAVRLPNQKRRAWLFSRVWKKHTYTQSTAVIFVDEYLQLASFKHTNDIPAPDTWT